MTASDLLEALEKTGTAPAKLDKARAALAQKPGLEAMGLVAEMDTRDAEGRKPWPEGTVDKARRLLAGAPVSEFLGVPPRNAEEAKIAAIGEAVGHKVIDLAMERLEHAQANSVGLPVKPAKAK